MDNLAKSRTPEKTRYLLGVTNSIQYVEAGVPAAMFIGGVLGHDKELRENSLYVASSTAISLGLTLLIKHFVRRPRPFIRNKTFIPVYRAGSTSFPSGHTSTTFALASSLSIAYPKWYVIAPAFIYAGTVGYSRMYLGEHFPTDVAAGATIGVGSAVALSGLSR
ncbi:phosphatase PAP2 family protein [Mucilaginibacter ginkgonis]|uniref:Phosphatase PAP2 family protein n=2 Tax=Mucilaginibacter ginkgonis TaxID=2682091 RepID=A0A6I4IMR1_9SPHI|nr:phosphatase PAP2 family protein [Mucilaginibacter ginkgonis]